MIARCDETPHNANRWGLVKLLSVMTKPIKSEQVTFCLQSIHTLSPLVCCLAGQTKSCGIPPATMATAMVATSSKYTFLHHTLYCGIKLNEREENWQHCKTDAGGVFLTRKAKGLGLSSVQSFLFPSSLWRVLQEGWIPLTRSDPAADWKVLLAHWIWKHEVMKECTPFTSPDHVGLTGATLFWANIAAAALQGEAVMYYPGGTLVQVGVVGKIRYR